MAGLIPQEFIDDLVARADIVEVVGRRVPLKRAGREFKACCPFHEEKTPSFTVSPTKGFYHCFGCGAHGTAVGFLMDYDHLGFVEAIEALAGITESGPALAAAVQAARAESELAASQETALSLLAEEIRHTSSASRIWQLPRVIDHEPAALLDGLVAELQAQIAHV